LGPGRAKCTFYATTDRAYVASSGPRGVRRQPRMLSGDAAFDWIALGAVHQGGVALRLPPHSMNCGSVETRPFEALRRQGAASHAKRHDTWLVLWGAGFASGPACKTPTSTSKPEFTYFRLLS
jgi:hypothetical protein